MAGNVDGGEMDYVTLGSVSIVCFDTILDRYVPSRLKSLTHRW